MKKPDIELDRRGLMKLMREAAHSKSLYDVFRDFCEAAAISIANTVDLAQREAREARWEQVKASYPDDAWALFPKMLGCVVGEFEKVDYADVLGQTFMELELANKDAGQFFTPYHLCKVMAQCSVDDSLKEQIAAKGFITACDPACGGGATLIAFAEAMQAAGFNPQTKLHVIAQDIDIRSVHMTYLQLSLFNIPAIVQCGNTLSMEVRSRWYTPAHILGGWDWNLRANDAAVSAKNALLVAEEKPEEVAAPIPDVTLKTPEQIQMFTEPA